MARLQTFKPRTFGGRTFNDLYGSRSPTADAQSQTFEPNTFRGHTFAALYGRRLPTTDALQQTNVDPT